MASPPTDPLAALTTLDGEDLGAAPADAPPAAEAAPVLDEARFQPPSAQQVGLGLELELAAPAPVAVPERATLAPEPEPTQLDPVRRCAEHDLPEPCATCIDLDQPIPGRLFEGALRRQPLVRLGAGLALGLLVGYLASLPFSGRAERRVAIVKAEADQIRYRNAPELQDETRRLDARADEMANGAALGTVAIWLVVGGAVVAGWYRAT